MISRRISETVRDRTVVILLITSRWAIAYPLSIGVEISDLVRGGHGLYPFYVLYKLWVSQCQYRWVKAVRCTCVRSVQWKLSTAVCWSAWRERRCEATALRARAEQAHATTTQNVRPLVDPLHRVTCIVHTAPDNQASADVWDTLPGQVEARQTTSRTTIGARFRLLDTGQTPPWRRNLSTLSRCYTTSYTVPNISRTPSILRTPRRNADVLV